MSRRWTWQRWIPRRLDRNPERAARAHEKEVALVHKVIELDRKALELDRLTEETLANLDPGNRRALP